MFNLSENNIHLSMQAKSKEEAIELAAHFLMLVGCVESGYGEAMIKRESAISTFLGNGIAIPHGTLDARGMVKKTGVQILQFPEGVKWDDDNIVYLVIGIAANSDEHLELLRQLTHFLTDLNKVKRLASEKNIHIFRDIFMDEDCFKIDECDITLDINTESLLTLVATNVEKLQKKNAVDEQFISEVISSPALPIGQGLWITDSTTGNKKNALVFSRAQHSFTHNSKLIHGVLTVSMVDEKLNGILALLLEKDIQQILLSGDANQISTVLNTSFESNSCKDSDQGLGNDVISKEFVVSNTHGLHTRPIAILVHEIKKYNASVLVENLDRNLSPVNAKSPIKIASLGVLKGHRIKFTATGEQAQEVINNIEKMMVSGLGE